MEGAYAIKYAPDDSITTVAAIEDMLSADTPIGRLMGGLSFLLYVLLILLVLLFSLSSFVIIFIIVGIKTHGYSNRRLKCKVS
jgi:hypothetical protein